MYAKDFDPALRYGATLDVSTEFGTTQRLNFRDTGIYIYSPADGKISIVADGTGADDITLSGTTTASDNITISSNKKLYFRDTGLYINSGADGKLTIAADGTGNDDITLSGTVVLGGTVVPHTTKTGAYTTTANDFIVGVDTTGGAVTITLGSAAVAAGKVVIINDEGGNAGINNITIATEGSETIDGSATTTISTDNATVRLYSDGTNWFTF